MAKLSDIQARHWRKWTPAWWGNLDDPEPERWWFEVHPLSMIGRMAWQERIADLVRPVMAQRTSGDRGALAGEDVLSAGQEMARGVLAALGERVRVRGLYDDDGQPLIDAIELLSLATETQIGELRKIVEEGISEAEGKG